MYRTRSAPSGPPSAVDDQFFSLADFHRDADEGEYQMAKRLRGEALSDDEDDLDDLDDESGEGGIDLFAPVDGLGGEGSDEDEDEADLDVGGVMFRDFFDAPSGGRGRKPPPKGKGKAAEQGKGKKPAAAPAPAPVAAADDAVDLVEDGEPPKKKRGVRFSEAVKVKEIPHRLAGKKRAAAALGEDGDEDEDAEGIERLEDLVAGSDDEEEMGEGGSDEEDEDEDEMEGLERQDEMDVDEEQEDEEGSVEDDEDELAGDQKAIERFNADLFGDEEDEEEDKRASLSFSLSRRLLASSMR